jgi:hypothetical protein
VSLNINPPGLPQSDGSFPIVAGATFANNATCGFTSAGTEGGSQSGLAVGFTMVSNGVSTVTFGGTTIDSSGTTLNGSMSITGGGPCSGSSAAITLKKS